MGSEALASCGLYCSLCASRGLVPAQASTLRESLCREGYHLGYHDIPGLHKLFPTFWEALTILADSPCPGCRAGGGYQACQIRACVQQRQVMTCPFCQDFPCDRLHVLRRYPLVEVDGRRMRRIGVSRWIAEQEARVSAGFCYGYIRYPDDVEEVLESPPNNDESG